MDEDQQRLIEIDSKSVYVKMHIYRRRLLRWVCPVLRFNENLPKVS